MRRVVGLAAALACAVPALAQSPAAPLPYTPHLVRTPDGLAISAQEWGNPGGPAILFIHGYAQAGMSWTRQVTDPALAARFRMVTYDLRGHGNSDKPVGNEWYREGRRWADEVKAVIDTIGLSRPVLVGWSYGGRVIGDYLTQHGQAAISGINFVGAVTSTADPQRFGTAAGLLGGATSDDLATGVRAIIAFLRACFEVQPTQAEFETMLAFNSMMPRHARIGLVGRTADYEAPFRALGIPVLVTHGEKDQAVRPTMGRYTVEAIPGAQASFYENIGHSPFWEDAPRFNRELAALVARAAR
jgi:pimeloyl-ACP methyl ester carboxylesterase